MNLFLHFWGPRNFKNGLLLFVDNDDPHLLEMTCTRRAGESARDRWGYFFQYIFFEISTSDPSRLKRTFAVSTQKKQTAMMAIDLWTMVIESLLFS
jgi:hypothetical protein